MLRLNNNTFSVNSQNNVYLCVCIMYWFPSKSLFLPSGNYIQNKHFFFCFFFFLFRKINQSKCLCGLHNFRLNWTAKCEHEQQKRNKTKQKYDLMRSSSHFFLLCVPTSINKRTQHNHNCGAAIIEKQKQNNFFLIPLCVSTISLI